MSKRTGRKPSIYLDDAFFERGGKISVRFMGEERGVEVLPIIEIDGFPQEFTAYKIDLRARGQGADSKPEIGAAITLWRGDCGEVIEKVVAEAEDGKGVVTAREGWTGSDHQTFSGKLEFPPTRAPDGRQVYRLWTSDYARERFLLASGESL